MIYKKEVLSHHHFSLLCSSVCMAWLVLNLTKTLFKLSTLKLLTHSNKTMMLVPMVFMWLKLWFIILKVTKPFLMIFGDTLPMDYLNGKIQLCSKLLPHAFLLFWTAISKILDLIKYKILYLAWFSFLRILALKNNLN